MTLENTREKLVQFSNYLFIYVLKWKPYFCKIIVRNKMIEKVHKLPSIKISTLNCCIQEHLVIVILGK
jgi:hypothetical protein